MGQVYVACIEVCSVGPRTTQMSGFFDWIRCEAASWDQSNEKVVDFGTYVHSVT
jgi:hypothetical protein